MVIFNSYVSHYQRVPHLSRLAPEVLGLTARGLGARWGLWIGDPGAQVTGSQGGAPALIGDFFPYCHCQIFHDISGKHEKHGGFLMNIRT